MPSLQPPPSSTSPEPVINKHPSFSFSTKGKFGTDIWFWNVTGAGDILPFVESDLNKTASNVLLKAKMICTAQSVHNVQLETMEGDARNVLCEAVDKFNADILVVGSHGYGAIKRSELNYWSTRWCFKFLLYTSVIKVNILCLQGCFGKCEWPLCSSCSLHCDGSEKAQK